MEVLGLIPARIGSSEVKKKNIRSIYGKPLIFYSIAEACRSKKLQRVILSTDSEEIRMIGKELGAETPFLRPGHLATNEASLFPVIIHCLEFLKEKDYCPDAVFLLRPTSPLRTAEHIDEAISLLGDNNVDSVVSIEPVKQHPYCMYIRHRNNYFVEYDAAKNKPERRQDLPELWITNDHTLLSTVNYLNEDGEYFEKTINGFYSKVFQHETDHLNGLLIADRCIQQDDLTYPYGNGEKGVPKNLLAVKEELMQYLVKSYVCKYIELRDTVPFKNRKWYVCNSPIRSHSCDKNQLKQYCLSLNRNQIFCDYYK